MNNTNAHKNRCQIFLFKINNEAKKPNIQYKRNKKKRTREFMRFDKIYLHQKNTTKAI